MGPEDGPQVVLVHGMGRPGAALDPVAETLAAAGLRALVVDRRGYGASPAPEGYSGTTVSEQGEDLVGFLHGLGPSLTGPPVLAGADVGALACLDVLLRHPGLAAGAALADPPLLSLVPEATDALGAERIALEEKLRDGGPRAAMEAYLGEATDASPAAFFADFRSLATLTVTRRELRSIARPVALVATERAEIAIRSVISSLAGLLADVRTAPDLAAGVLALRPVP